MATFKNRALTLATVGVLSGVAITIATNGVIQQRAAIIEPPQVTAPAFGGGTSRIVGEQFKLEYPRLYEFYSYLPIELHAQTRIDFERAQIRDRQFGSVNDIFLLVGAESNFASLQRAVGDVSITVLSAVTVSKTAIAHFTGDQDAYITSNAYTRYTPAGALDYAHASRIDVDAHATFVFERGPLIRVIETEEGDIVAPVLVDARDYAFTADARIFGDSEARAVFTAAPRQFDHLSNHVIEVEFDAHSVFEPVSREYADFRYASNGAVSVAGNAAYIVHTQHSDAYRYDARFDTQLFGIAMTEFVRDVLPRAYDEEEEILLLFAKMMQDES